MQSDRTPAATLPVASTRVASPLAHASNYGRARVDANTTVERYARLWIEEYQGRTSRGIDPSTRHDYRRSLELHVLPALGELPLAHVTPRDIRAVIIEAGACGARPRERSEAPRPGPRDARHRSRRRADHP